MCLDIFFGAPNWILENSKAVVRHIKKQASDYSLLIWDTNPEVRKRKSRFYFDKR